MGILFKQKSEDIAKKDRESLSKALESHTTLRIKKKLQDTLSIPPLSEFAREILELRKDENAGVIELVKVLEKDPSLSAQIVGWASSAYYSAPGSISTVHDAVCRVLGFDLVMNIAFGISVGETLKIKDQKDYWLKAVWTATLSQKIARLVPDKTVDPGLAYLAGLLHNFGYVIMSHVFPSYHETIQAMVKEDPTLVSSDLEEEMLQVNSEQLNSLMLQEWKLPDEVVIGVRFQKEPDYKDKYSDYSYLLNACVQILRENNLYSGVAGNYEPILDKLKIQKKDVSGVVEKVLSERDSIDIIANTLVKNT